MSRGITQGSVSGPYLFSIRKDGFIQDIAQVSNIPQCTELPILGATFQENSKYSEHLRAKLIEANKCLIVLRSLRKEGFSQGEVDHLFSALVLHIFYLRRNKDWLIDWLIDWVDEEAKRDARAELAVVFLIKGEFIFSIPVKPSNLIAGI